jgi:hypothetical protein
MGYCPLVSAWVIVPSSSLYPVHSSVKYNLTKMSYAEAAAKGPKQSPEEVQFNDTV